MDVVIQGGTVVTAVDVVQADIGIVDERIALLATEIEPGGARTIDAKGCLVLPGAIDAHTHMEWPGSADDFETGTRAAAFGGVTTIIDFAIQRRGQTLHQTLAEWRAKADPAVCIDYGVHMAISDFNPERAREIADLVTAGVTSYKLWMTSRHSGGLGVDDGTIVQVMGAVAEQGALIGLHCENDTVIEMLVAGFLREGRTGPLYHRLSRPPFVEAEAIRRAATFAEAADCSLYIPHLSSAQGLVAVREAQARGMRIVAETCPQFLALTDEVYSRPDAARYIMSPPIKAAADQEALWDGLAQGDIVTVGSDHCPYSDEMKARGQDDFSRTPNGVPGTEVILPLLFSHGVSTGRLTLRQLAAVTSENPARLFGLYPRKGTIAIGSDADLVILDPARRARLDSGTLHSKIGYSLYDHITVTGYPVTTLLRGRVVCHDGQFLGASGTGQFLRRAVPAADCWSETLILRRIAGAGGRAL